MNPTKYRAEYAEDVLNYFRSYLGYWERRLEQTEERLISEEWKRRAEETAERQRKAMEDGLPFSEDTALLVDPEHVLSSARVKAYEQILTEMTVKRRLQGLPTLVKWARRVGVSMSTIRKWREKNERFDAACEECMEIQADILKDGGLSGIYTSKTALFLLQTIHGVRNTSGEDEDASDGFVINISERMAKEEKDGKEVGTTADG